MVNRADQLLKLPRVDSTVDETMGVYGEAARIHEQSLMAMGQKSITEPSTVASTEVVMNLTPDLSSRKEHK